MISGQLALSEQRESKGGQQIAHLTLEPHAAGRGLPVGRGRESSEEILETWRQLGFRLAPGGQG